MKTLQVKLFALVFVVLLLTACGEQPVYTKTYAFKDEKWKVDVKPVFRFKIEDTTAFYTTTVNIRTTTDYKFADLWLFLHTRTPNGESGRVPYQVVMANPDGSWAGTKSGSVVEQQLQFRHRKFPQVGEYVFTFEQGITDDVVNNILDVSLAVEKDKTK